MAYRLNTLNMQPVSILSSESWVIWLPCQPKGWLVAQQQVSLLRILQGIHWKRKGCGVLTSASPCTSFPDKCQPAPECRPGEPGPQAMDVDLVFVVDSSQDVEIDIYRGALHLVDAVLDDLEVAAQPSTSFWGARVALVTHTTPGFRPGVGRSPVLEGFHLTSYGHRTQMQRQVQEAMGRLLQGLPALGHALEWTLEKVLLVAPLPRRARVLFTIVASETSSWDREKLRTLSQEAKCRGITLFVLALGPGVGAHELVELSHVASAPSEQHLLRLEGVSEPEVAYARGFTRAFLHLLKSEQSLNTGYFRWVGERYLQSLAFGQVDAHHTFLAVGLCAAPQSWSHFQVFFRLSFPVHDSKQLMCRMLHCKM